MSRRLVAYVSVEVYATVMDAYGQVLRQAVEADLPERQRCRLCRRWMTRTCEPETWRGSSPPRPRLLGPNPTRL